MSTTPWERSPDESTQAFAAFAHYRDMGAHRSTAKVGQALGKSKTLMDRWCEQWHWVRRAAAWDAHMDQAALLGMRDKHTEMAVKLHTLGSAALQDWLAVMQLRAEQRAKDGHQQVPIIKPGELRQLIEAGIKLERLVRGEPDSIRQNILTGKDSKAIEIEHCAALDMPQLVELAKQAIQSYEGDTNAKPKSEEPTE